MCDLQRSTNRAAFVGLDSDSEIVLETPVSDLSRKVVSNGLAGFNIQGFRPNMKKSFFLTIATQQQDPPNKYNYTSLKYLKLRN